MPTSQFLGGIKRGATPDEIVDYVIRLERKLDFLLQNGLDSENIFEAGGWRIKPDQLASKDDDVGMSTTDTAGDDVRLWAGGTDKNTAPWRVTKSGKMNATGATIESQSGYPKVILDPSGNLFGAYLSADTSIQIVPNYSGTTPIINIYNGGVLVGQIFGDTGNTTTINGSSGLNLKSSGGDITLVPGTIPAKNVSVPSWVRVYSSGDAQSLQDALDSKQGTVSGGGSTITTANLTANRGLVSDSSGKVAVSATTSTEIGYVSGVTSAIQTQLNNRATVVSGGKKIQTGATGTQAASGSVITVTVTFPTAFTSAPKVFLTLDDTNTSTFRVWHSNITTTQFTLYFSGSTGLSSCHWMAVGD